MGIRLSGLSDMELVLRPVDSDPGVMNSPLQGRYDHLHFMTIPYFR